MTFKQPYITIYVLVFIFCFLYDGQPGSAFNVVLYAVNDEFNFFRSVVFILVDSVDVFWGTKSIIGIVLLTTQLCYKWKISNFFEKNI